VLGGWAVFRAVDLPSLGRILGAMAGLGGAGDWPRVASHAPEAWAAVAVGLALAFFAPTTARLVARFRWRTIVLAAAVLLASLGQLATRGYSPFIYFQF